MPGSGMPYLPVATSDKGVSPGEAYLEHTPALQSHAGTQPDLFLLWNRFPLAAASVDIVVHLHGFSQEGGALQKVGALTMLAVRVERGMTRLTIASLACYKRAFLVD